VEKYGMSRRTFFRCWSRHFNVSPARFVTQLKMEEAVRLLTESRFSIEEIAERLNFNETNYFCQVFRRFYDMTPMRYRSCNLPEGISWM